MWIVCIEGHWVGRDDDSRYVPRGEILDDLVVHDNHPFSDFKLVEIHYDGYLYSDTMKYYVTQLEWDRNNKIDQITS